ncbi:hypothetical protein AVEN_216563-1 [Araneus ventricosus]|uniref:Uncharacterized protein n=1 Tax=Araneus ventricosus TaxID=182803 RepID=A0A4Y2DVG6_ARAVE|nr:hypothetical protein AVEN_216563-1 [Araneus ventricosus]
MLRKRIDGRQILKYFSILLPFIPQPLLPFPEACSDFNPKIMVTLCIPPLPKVSISLAPPLPEACSDFNPKIMVILCMPTLPRASILLAPRFCLPPDYQDTFSEDPIGGLRCFSAGCTSEISSRPLHCSLPLPSLCSWAVIGIRNWTPAAYSAVCFDI